jgi:hypothetical protein
MRYGHVGMREQRSSIVTRYRRVLYLPITALPRSNTPVELQLAHSLPLLPQAKPVTGFLHLHPSHQPLPQIWRLRVPTRFNNTDGECESDCERATKADVRSTVFYRNTTLAYHVNQQAGIHVAFPRVMASRFAHNSRHPKFLSSSCQAPSPSSPS